MPVIVSIKARQIDDSRCNPTVEVDETLDDGTFVRAAVPSGASSGICEALELRDGGSDYLGKGVSKAVNNVNTIIAPALIGKDPTDQTAIDNFMVQELDGTVNEWGWCKQKLGANALLAVSLAVCKAGAAAKKIPLYQHNANLAGNSKLILPVPAFNVINGSSHTGNKLAMQEFMVLPVGASSFKEAMKMGSEVYHHLKAVIKKKYGQDATNVGDEGGFDPNIQENEEGLELLKTAIAKVGYTGKVCQKRDIPTMAFHRQIHFLAKSLPCSSKVVSWDRLKGPSTAFSTDSFLSSRDREQQEQIRRIRILLQQNRTDSAHRYVKSLVLTKSSGDEFSSPSKLFAMFSHVCPLMKPSFLSTLLFVFADSKMTKEGIELYDLMKKEGIPPSVPSLNLLLESLVGEKQYQKVIEMVDEVIGHSVHADSFAYAKAVQAAVKLGDLRKGFKLMDCMKEKGVRITVFVYNVMIAGLCKTKRTGEAERLFAEMCHKNLVGTVVTYNSLIDGYCKAGEIDKAFKLRERMGRENIKPNLVTYNSLLNGLCRSGKMEDVKGVLEEMESNGFAPDKFTKGILFGSSLKHGNAEASLSLCEEKGIRMNRYTSSILLNCLCKQGRVDEAVEVLNRIMANGFVPDVIEYNTLVSGYCLRGDLDGAISLTGQMEARGVKPVCVTYNCLISKFCDTGEIDKAEDWKVRMLKKGISPNLETYNILIDGYGRMGNFDKCFMILEEMENTDIKPNVVSYGSLINALCKNGKLIEAEIVLGDMTFHGIVPNPQIYNMLIDGCCAAGKLDCAFKHLDEMGKNDVCPTLVTYNALINGLCKAGRLSEAEEFVARIRNDGYSPDVITYNCLISGHSVAGNPQRCLKFYEEMKALHIKPTLRTFHPLIYGCGRDSLAMIETILKEMSRMNIAPDRLVYDDVIRWCVHHGDVQNGYSKYKDMIDHGIHPDKVTFNNLIWGHFKQGTVTQMNDLVDKMRSEQLCPKADTYTILVKGYCDHGDFSTAYFWYREMLADGFTLSDYISRELVNGLKKDGRLEEAEIVCSEMNVKEMEDGVASAVISDK